MITDQTFGAWLKQRRRELDLTQEALAEHAGCSPQMIRRVEAGTARPSRQLAELLVISLQIPPAGRAEYVQWARSGQRTIAPDPQTIQATDAQRVGEHEQPAANPYKGLRAFQESDAGDFFGREALTSRLVSRLGEPARLGRFLTVVGPSGSGKSSVVRAGVVPALRKGVLEQFVEWPVLDIVPGAHPFEEVEAALLRVAVNPPSSLMPQLQEDERGLVRAVKRALPGQQDGLVLVLDQFEEIFTLVEDEGVRRHFLNSLYAAAADPSSPLVVVATLRADFYDRPLGYLQSGELLRERAEVVLPMSAEELEKAIVLPAAQVGVGLESDLLAAIVHDTGEQPGALPLLQYALTELFERREGRLMTLRAYRASGGVHGALSRRAESLYAELNEVEQPEARQMFLRLVTLGEGVEDTRRRVRRSEIASAARDEQALERVLDLFGRHRLLTFDRDPVAQAPTVEVAHEALLRSWPRLRDWLDASRESLRAHRRLIAATSEWDGAGHDPSFLAQGVRLAQFEALQAEGDLALNAQERQYLESSQEAVARAEAEQEAQRENELQAARQLAETQRRSATQLRRRAYFLAGVLLLALLMAGLAIYFGSRASASAADEQAARLKAEQSSRLSTSRELAAAALNNLDVDPERSILLALQAISTTYGVDKTWTSEAENAMHRSVLASHALLTFQTRNKHQVWGMAFSPDGKRLATSSDDGTIAISDIATGKELLAMQVYSSANSVAFSHDGKLLATASDDGKVRLWNASTGQLIRTMAHNDAVNWVSFSPDDKRLGSASWDKTARVWDVATGRELLNLKNANAVASFSFSPDSKRLLTGVQGGTFLIWDATTGKKLLTIQENGIGAFAIGLFSPDGTKIATFDHVWDATTGQQLSSFSGHTNVIYDEAMSPDGTKLATVSRDRTARVWDAASGKELLTLWGHNASVFSVAFSPDGSRLATADGNDVVKVWDLQPDRELLAVPPDRATTSGENVGQQAGSFSADGSRLFTTASFGDDPVKADSEVRVLDAVSGRTVFTAPVGPRIEEAVLSPDGKLLAIGAGLGGSRVLDASTGHQLIALNNPGVTSYGIAFSPDGKRIATGDDDNAARVWDAATGKMLLALKGHTDVVWGVSFSPDGKRLATASLDGTARIWDLSSARTVLTLTGHTDGVYGTAFSPDGTRLATASRDGTAKIWDAATGRELLTLKGHTSTLTQATFSPDGKRLATASQDTTVKIWDAATGEELLTLPGMTGAVFSPDGSRLATFDPNSNAINVYTLRIEDLVALAKSRLTRTWTLDECREFLHTDQCPP